MGGAVGIWGSVVLLHGLSLWQPFTRWPIHMPVNPDAHVYAVDLLLTQSVWKQMVTRAIRGKQSV